MRSKKFIELKRERLETYKSKSMIFDDLIIKLIRKKNVLYTQARCNTFQGKSIELATSEPLGLKQRKQ